MQARPNVQGSFWTNMLKGVDDEASLEDFIIPVTQDTQADLDEEVHTEVEVVDVQARAGVARPRATRPNQKSQKKIHSGGG